MSDQGVHRAARVVIPDLYRMVCTSRSEKCLIQKDDIQDASSMPLESDFGVGILHPPPPDCLVLTSREDKLILYYDKLINNPSMIVIVLAIVMLVLLVVPLGEG
jgi:hypothetical protein